MRREINDGFKSSEDRNVETNFTTNFPCRHYLLQCVYQGLTYGLARLQTG